jgi:hypothetical protein
MPPPGVGPLIRVFELLAVDRAATGLGSNGEAECCIGSLKLQIVVSGVVIRRQRSCWLTD